MGHYVLQRPAPRAAAPSTRMGADARTAVSRGLSPRPPWVEVSPFLYAPLVSRGLMAPAHALPPVPRRGLRLGNAAPGLGSPGTPLLTAPPRPLVIFGNTKHLTLTLTLALALALTLTLTLFPPLTLASWTSPPGRLYHCLLPRQWLLYLTPGPLPLPWLAPLPGNATTQHRPMSRDGGLVTPRPPRDDLNRPMSH